MSETVADVVVEVLRDAGVKRCYGLPGDTLNYVTDALRRSGEIRFVHVRHEEVGGFAAIEARWKNRKPSDEVLIGWPDMATRTNKWAITIPHMGSIVDSLSWNAAEYGLEDFPEKDWPPVPIPFFAFRIMVGCGVLMLGLAWLGSWTLARGRMEQRRWLLWATFFSFPLGFVATLTGWFTAESGRQPWTVYGVLRTADAVTPFLRTPEVATTLAMFFVVYATIFLFGTAYIYRLLKRGPAPLPHPPVGGTNPKRPLSVPGDSPGTERTNEPVMEAAE